VINFPPTVRIFLAPADIRRGFDGLASLTTSVIGENPLSGHLFVFRNRCGDRLKILYWDGDGLALWAKRLERRVSRVPTPQGHRVEVRPAEPTVIFERIDLRQAQRKRRYALNGCPS
jgi:transposase